MAHLLWMSPETRIEHHLPGRMRLKIPALKGKSRALRIVCDAVAQIPEVQRIEANPLTGSILIFYNARQRAFASLIDKLGEDRRLFRLGSNPAANPGRGRRIAGRCLLAVGVAGVLLPVIPGTPFLIAGAAILGSGDPVVGRGLKLVGQARRLLRPKQ